jgi:methylthioribulose-1-phosphate dehydratase
MSLHTIQAPRLDSETASQRDALPVAAAREQLIEAIHSLHRRGWAPGTSGNYSVLLEAEPFRLLMSPSGCDKGRLSADDLLVVDEHGTKLTGKSSASAETLLHITVIKHTGARAVLHTHSIWNTLLSGLHREHGALTISGYELLKGLRGVTTHETTERVPILKNSQDIPALAKQVETLLNLEGTFHGFLLENHGLYTWGNDLDEALRHAEVFEFLFEVLGRKSSLTHRSF